MIPLFLIDGFFLILSHTLACIPHLHLLLHTFHITFTLCMHSNFSCLCSHGLYFSFLHFTLVRCMIQSRPVANSTRSPNPSPTASGFIAGRLRFAHRFRFRFACTPVSDFLYDFSLLASRFPVCLPTGFRFCLTYPILLPTNF